MATAQFTYTSLTPKNDIDIINSPFSGCTLSWTVRNMKIRKISVCAVIMALITAVTGVFSVSAAIEPGAVGDDVAAMQNKLIALGYLSFSVSGDYDESTGEAVRFFEAANGLTADGRADDIMLGKLEKVYNDAARAVVTAESADIFSDTGIFSTRLGTLKEGDLCVVLGTETVSGVTWYNFRYGTEDGWISGNNAEYIEPASTVGYFTAAVVNVAALDVRKGAGKDNPKVTTLRKGAVVAVKASQEVSGVTWYCYETDGEEHWINGNYVILHNCAAESAGASVTVKTTVLPTTTTTTTASEVTEVTTVTAASEIEYTDSVFAHSDEYRLGRYYDSLCRAQKTGVLRTDIAIVSLSQVGYHEGSNINDVSGDSRGSANYTEYGVNYGNPNDYWCAMFIWWCARQAGVGETVIPKTGSAKAEAFGCENVPFESNIDLRTGDILFIDNTGDENEDHVALVISVTADTITTVEGNISNSVKQRTYSRASGSTRGGDARIVKVGYPDYENAGKESSETATTTAATTATMQTEAVTAPTMPAEPKKVTANVQFAAVDANVLNLRCGPGSNYAKVAAAQKGSEYAVIGTRDVSGVTWYNLIYKGDSVWAMGTYLVIRDVSTVVDYVDISSYNTKEPRYLSRTAVINADADLLYTRADYSSAPVAVLKKGVDYTVVGSGGNGTTTWHKINVDGIEGYISRYNLTLTNHYTQIPDRDFTAKTPVIYLSPSRQGANPYIIGNTSEQAEMEALGDIIYEKLSSYDCEVYVAPPEYTLEKRAQHAYSLDTDIYIAIHSNATGNATVHYGPSAYYFPGCEQSRQYAQSIVDSLNKVVPLGSNLNAQVIDGMRLAGGCGYAEVREPGKLGMIGVLVETDFHDYEPTAQWLMKEKETAADAYVDSLVNAFGLRLKETAQSE